MESVRLATAEEIEGIKAKADLGPGCSVVTFGGTDFAVVRQLTELDPVFFGDETNDRRKAAFIFALETAMRFMGIPAYYFNVKTDDEKWQHVAKTNGAEQVSPTPELRFKKVL
jgi:hypothetical protein